MDPSLVARADRAFVDEDYETAIELYGKAIEESPSASLYESRAHAHIKIEDWMAAASDASKAVEIDPSMPKAHLRRGVALLNLAEYESAKMAFEEAQRLDPANAQIKIWIRKCMAELDEEERSAQAAPSRQEPSAGAAAPAPAAIPTPPSADAATSSAPLAPSAPPPVPEGKYRHQYYQLHSKVTVDVYAKNLPKDRVTCEFSETRLKVVVKAAPEEGEGAEDYELDVELYGKIIPDQSRYEVLKSKVEITMTKADVNIAWGSLEKSTKIAAPNYSTPGTTAPAQYPSSTKTKKDWSKVDAEITDLEKKGELDDGDPLNNFFKKIFSQGDEDTRRAMMKSFQESNGTVLSTNWSDIGKKKTECTPPDGMVVNKYEV